MWTDLPLQMTIVIKMRTYTYAPLKPCSLLPPLGVRDGALLP